MIPLGSAKNLDSFELKSVEPNDLVRRILTGCPDSATALWNHFTPRLLILLERRLAGRRSDAEDIAQESLAKAFQHLHRFDFNYQFSTWLYTIAFRLAMDFSRKEKRRPQTVSMDALESEPMVGQVSQARNASEVVEDIWSLARSVLVKSQYTILWLKYGEGLSIQEIAVILQKTEIGVRVQLHRARSKLTKDIRRMDCEPVVTRGNHSLT